MPTKTIKAEPDSEAGVVVASNTARMHGNKDNYVLSNQKGTTIGGPVSFPGGSSQLRFSALWTMNSELMLSLPSTMATPTPVMNIRPPLTQLASLMAEVGIMVGPMIL